MGHVSFNLQGDEKARFRKGKVWMWVFKKKNKQKYQQELTTAFRFKVHRIAVALHMTKKHILLAMVCQELPVAFMPYPCMTANFGKEVSPAQVVNLRGEAQQASIPLWPVHTVSRGRKAAFLMGTVQHVQWAVLKISCLLYQLGTHY